MKFALKSLTAAVLLAAASGAAFAASNDGLPANGVGNGTGDLVFAYEAADGQSSILWDLSNGADDLDWTSMLSKTSFSISNTNVTSFVAANPGGRWNIFGLTNTKTSGTTPSNIVYNKAGVGITVNGAPNLNSTTGNTGAKIETAMDTLAQWIADANFGGFPNNGTLTATAADLWQFSSNNHGGASGFLAGQFATGLVDTTLGYWNILIDSTVQRGLSASSSNALGKAPTFAQLGTFNFASNGNLVYSTAPVPVPAAVWLMGSALAGIAATRRRKA